MNVAITIDDVQPEALISGTEAGPARRTTRCPPCGPPADTIGPAHLLLAPSGPAGMWPRSATEGPHVAPLRPARGRVATLS